jgi:hypothetical protein
MEALSRREENEVMATAKTEALKQCDEVVKGMPFFPRSPAMY